MNCLRLIIYLFLSGIGCSSYTQDILGTWYGQVDLGGPKLNIILDISADGESLSTTLNSLNQGLIDFITDKTTQKNDSLFIYSDSLELLISTEISASANRSNGTYSQYGIRYPFSLSRDTFEVSEMRRPQEPNSFDYYQENVVFANYQDSLLFAGTLSMPYEPGIEKAVILISDSGPHDRNSEYLDYDHRPFLVLADYLTRQGIAVLRYDERGVGRSMGNFYTATTADFAADASAAIDYVRSRVDLEGAQVGVIGLGEGGLVASMLADKADFFVLLGTPGVPTIDLMLAQTYLHNQRQGIPDSLLTINFRMYSQVYNYIKQTATLTQDSLQKNLRVLLSRNMKRFPTELQGSAEEMEGFIESQSTILTSPWYRFYLTIDPAKYLSQISQPLLALNGTLDTQVPYGPNLSAIEKATSGKNAKNEIYGFEGVNHLMQTAINGFPQEYGLLTETMNVEVMQAIGEWITQL